MALFYERKETNDEVIIRFKYPFIAILPVIWLFSYLLLTKLEIYRIILDFAFTIFCTVFIVETFKPFREVNTAKKENRVHFSESKFSLSKPLIARIKKKK